MKSATHAKRAKLTGKGRTHSFLRLPHYMLHSAEFRQLNGRAEKLLIYLAAQYRGNNNGDLSMPWSKMKALGFPSSDTLNKYKKELLNRGFISLTRQGGLHRCSLFAITWEAIDECNGKLDVRAENVASNLWKKSSASSESESIPMK